MTTYKAQVSYILSNSVFFIFPLVLTIITISEGSAVNPNEWFGVFGFWAIGIILILVPMGSRLEVGKDYVKSSLFGFKVLSISSEDVVSIKYGNLFRGGLGYGKGLNVTFLKDGQSKSTSFGEKFWGKEAIQHTQRVLENKENM